MNFFSPCFVNEILAFGGDVGKLLIHHLSCVHKILFRIFSPYQELRVISRTFSDVVYVLTRTERPKHV